MTKTTTTATGVLSFSMNFTKPLAYSSVYASAKQFALREPGGEAALFTRLPLRVVYFAAKGSLLGNAADIASVRRLWDRGRGKRQSSTVLRCDVLRRFKFK